MKTIGLIGGVSWVSSAEYYRQLNELVNRRLGGLNYARCLLYSFNLADIKKLIDQQDWRTTLTLVVDASRRLANAGADCILLCSNNMHVVADELRPALDIPLIHIAEATAGVIQQRRLSTVGLLGTKFTMEMDFFTKKLRAEGIQALIPPEAEREFVHTTIFEELGKGVFLDPTRRRYLDIIAGLVGRGAEGIVLGCTEIPLLIKPTDCEVALFDTVAIHAAAAVTFALDHDA